MAIILQESLRGLFYAPFYVALAHDAYATEGVTMRFVSAPEPGKAATAIMSGEADVNWGGPMRVMQTYHQDPACDLVSFAEVVTRDPFELLWLGVKGSAWFFRARPAAGVRLATVSEVPTPWMCLQEDLRRAGVAPGTIDRVGGGTMAENCAALLAGTVEVVQLFEPYVSTLLADHGCHVWYAQASRGPTSYTTFYARRATLTWAARRASSDGACDLQDTTMGRGCHRCRDRRGGAILLPRYPGGDPRDGVRSLQNAEYLGARSDTAAGRL